jgi:hypothetical protein
MEVVRFGFFMVGMVGMVQSEESLLLLEEFWIELDRVSYIIETCLTCFFTCILWKL